MSVQIEGRHLRVTDSTREYVTAKIEPLNRYFDGLHDIRVVLINEDEQKKVEIICSVIRGKQLVAKASHDNLNAALDEAAHKARELLKKFKGRLRGRQRERDQAPDKPREVEQEDGE